MRDHIENFMNGRKRSNRQVQKYFHHRHVHMWLIECNSTK